jgi:hypothetical protein
MLMEGGASISDRKKKKKNFATNRELTARASEERKTRNPGIHT